MVTAMILDRKVQEQWASAEKSEGDISFSLHQITEWHFHQNQGWMNIMDIVIIPPK